MFDLSAGTRARIMLVLRESVKSVATDDPDMWTCVKTRADVAVDLIWDDLTVYIETAVDDQKVAVLGKTLVTHEALVDMGADQAPRCLSPSWWRAQVLYNFAPFDRSFFGLVKNPIWWLLTFISITPVFGIRVVFFAFILLFVVSSLPPDEFQLVRFILGFKGTQFITGTMLAFKAAAEYNLCVHPHGTHSCDVAGPGVKDHQLYSCIDYLGSCLLVWVAFFCLPCSQPSAGSRDDIQTETAESNGRDLSRGDPQPSSLEAGSQPSSLEPGPPRTKCFCCSRWDPSRGGRLAGLLVWDLASFCLSSIFLLGMVWVDASHLRPGGDPFANPSSEALVDRLDTWEFRTSFYFARICYALLSFPFLVFNLPVVNGILTHVAPTGYNRYGLCLPCVLKPQGSPCCC